MDLLKKVSFVTTNSRKLSTATIAAFIASMAQLDSEVSVKVTIEVLDDISKMKKKYFAMVTELAKHAGYSLHKDRELFKEQLRNQIGIRSMKDVDTVEEASLAIEAVHQLAAEVYNYTFMPDGTDIKFNSKEGTG